MGPAAIPILLVAMSTAMAVSAQQQQAAAARDRADAESDAANYNAQVEANNAAVAEQNATLQENLANEEASAVRTRTARVLGQQQAAVGKSGITMTGSALDVAEDTAVSGALDEANVKYNGSLQAWNSRVNANNLNAQSTLSKGRSANAGLGVNAGAGMAMGATVVGGASSAYGSYASANPSRPTFNSNKTDY